MTLREVIVGELIRQSHESIDAPYVDAVADYDDERKVLVDGWIDVTALVAAIEQNAADLQSAREQWAHDALQRRDDMGRL